MADPTGVTIVGYTLRYAKAFAQLIHQWIEHYFAVEPEDRLALDNLNTAIEPGGEIFLSC